MTTSLLKIFGVLSVVLGIVFIFTSFGESQHVLFIFPSIIAGLLIIGLAELIESVKNIENKLVNGTVEDIGKILRNAEKYLFRSKTINIFNPHEAYPLIRIQEEYYVRARLLKNYIMHSGNDYHFIFPDREL